MSLLLLLFSILLFSVLLLLLLSVFFLLLLYRSDHGFCQGRELAKERFWRGEQRSSRLPFSHTDVCGFHKAIGRRRSAEPSSVNAPTHAPARGCVLAAERLSVTTATDGRDGVAFEMFPSAGITSAR